MEKSKLWMIIIIAVLVIMCAGFVVGFILLKNTISNSASGSTSEAVSTKAPANTGVPEKDLDELPVVTGQVVPLMLSGDDTKLHYLKYSFGITLDKTDVTAYDELYHLLTGALAPGAKAAKGEEEGGTGKLAFIQSQVSAAISAITYAQLQSDQAKPLLQEKILQELRDHFETNVIYRVYFTDWLPQ